MFGYPTGYNSIEEFEKKLKTEPDETWIYRGELRALQLFHSMAKRVPAYQDFLKKNRINPESIKSIRDFNRLPTLDKDNYLRAYPRKALCWDGNFSTKTWTISTTSGSTGEPYYFPREKNQDKQYALTAELYLRNNFQIHKRTTLYIDGFAMGAWIGGLFTYQAIKYIAESGGYSLSIITPGIFKSEIIKAVRNLGDDFEQIIIGGYPPMIKDMVDDALKDGINWKQYKLGFIFSAEGFTEEFREYIIEKTGVTNSYLGTLNHYGTVDLGTMAHETPLTVLIRKLISGNASLNNSVFKRHYHLPTLTQYIPEMFFFEEKDERLYCSAASGFPLVRYDLKDTGGVYTIAEISQLLEEAGIDLDKKVTEAGIDKVMWKLPMVYVHERSDFIVKLYGANIYPDTIRKTLHQKEFQEILTGKFTMEIKYDKKQNQFLEIHVEMKKNVVKTVKLKEFIRKKIVSQLLRENSEFVSNYKEAPDKQLPHIVLWDYEHPQYFKSGGKQKWVKL